jgi:hypothetical protein
VFLGRLRQAAARDGFTVTTVRFYRPRQVAPYVRVQTRQYLRLSQTMRSLTKTLNPHHGTSDLTGYSYEGFFLEADDERGVPFAIASDLTRGQVEGSQWARSDALFPFPHG